MEVEEGSEPTVEGATGEKGSPTQDTTTAEADVLSAAVDSVFLQNLKGSSNVAELLATDSEDESLRRYKEALLGSAAHGDVGDPTDPRKLILAQFVISYDPSQGLTDLVYPLDSAGIERLAREGITMKEGARFKFRISFRVQHEIVVGIKFINTVSKMLFTEREELMIGSYPPSSTPHTFDFPKWEYSIAPSGMLYRGTYKVKNLFVFNKGEVLTSFEYPLHIIK
jgi:Rho GDP-dissociation inhibitor